MAPPFSAELLQWDGRFGDDTQMERRAFDRCKLIDADFFAAVLSASQFLACALTVVELSRSIMARSDSEVRPSKREARGCTP